jgi:hypothetical protein
VSEVKKSKPAPIFGVISLVLPFVGIPFGYWVIKPSDVGEGWDGFMKVVCIILFTIICGIISGLISLARREKYFAIALWGIFFNILPILLVGMKK